METISEDVQSATKQVSSPANDEHVLPQAPRFFLILGGTLLVFVGALQVVISISFFVGLPIGGLDVLLAGMVAAWATRWCVRIYWPGQRWLYAAVFVGCLVVIGLSLTVSAAFYDLSVDGRSYHTQAVAALAQGWNPVRDAPLSQGVMPEYVNFYTKGPWLEGAVIYRLTGNLQMSKAFNLLWLAIAFCLAYPAFSTRLKSGQALLLAVLVALNPVIVVQLLSLYVDGQFACLVSAAISLLILLAWQPNRLLAFCLAATVMMSINAKLTGPVYMLILIGGFWLWYALSHRAKRIELALWLVGGTLVGVFLVGFNPFVTQYVAQTVARGDPFYPTTYVDLTRIDYTAPADFKGQDALTRFFRSVFSRPEGEIEKPTVYKIPFTLSPSEIVAFYFPDTHVGGFGPFFGGIVLLLLLTLVVSLRRIRNSWPQVAVIALISGLLCLSVAINPEAWWARYVPQLWLPPLLAVFIIALVACTRFQVTLVRLLLTALLLNSVIVLTANIVQQQRASNLIVQALSQLKQVNDQGLTVPIKFGFSAADPIVLNSAHIHYTIVDQLPCPPENQRRWPGTNTQYCLPPG